MLTPKLLTKWARQRQTAARIVGVLNWFLPHFWIPAVAWIDSALEFFSA